MSAFPTRIEREAGRPLRENFFSRLRELAWNTARFHSEKRFERECIALF
jgi:hypothetical protein